jgi:hydroxyacylglutathione hydrolase
MLLKYIYDPRLAQASYLVGCQEAGVALVIDPSRDLTPYLQLAQAENLRITQVVETHIHADFVSGARELADRTGARLFLSAEGGPDWQYAFTDEQTMHLHDGDAWMLGAVKLEALHTPGHTPEHLMIRLTDTAGADEPMGLFTGDCLFVGDMGRPDLLERAANVAGTKEQGARQQYANVQRLAQMPDYLQIWPGHGAGSACGKALGALPSSTLGYEKRFNPAFHQADEAAFVNWLLADQPEPPRYFGQMKRVNWEGPALLRDLRDPECLEPFVLNQLLKDGVLVIDTRPIEKYAYAHLAGTINIAEGNSFSTYAGEFIDFDKPTYLIAYPESIGTLVDQLRAIGVDQLPGYFRPRDLEHSARATLGQIDPDAASALLSAALIVDVRNTRERNEAHIPGSVHIPLGSLEARLDELPRDRQLITQCGSGVRSQIAASVLQKHGFSHVLNLTGGLDEWRKTGQAVEG